MFLYIGIALFVIWITLLLLAQFKGGLWAGRKFGDRVADHIVIERKLFHAILANGVDGPSFQLLAMLEKAGLSPEQASIQLANSLGRGMHALKEKFGRQPQMDEVEPKIELLLGKFEEFQHQQQSRATN